MRRTKGLFSKKIGKEWLNSRAVMLVIPKCGLEHSNINSWNLSVMFLNQEQNFCDPHSEPEIIYLTAFIASNSII